MLHQILECKGGVRRVEASATHVMGWLWAFVDQPDDSGGRWNFDISFSV